MHVVYVTN